MAILHKVLWNEPTLNNSLWNQTSVYRNQIASKDGFNLSVPFFTICLIARCYSEIVLWKPPHFKDILVIYSVYLYVVSYFAKFLILLLWRLSVICFD